jgi:uncharacterized protein YdaU (DUF1376 family)
LGTLRWYKRDPNAALQGMAMLSLEERGAYNTILDLLYARDGNLPDIEAELARLLHCDVRVWRRVRRRLMDLGKLYIHGGSLHNARADDEINYALSRIAKTKLAGLKGAETRRLQRRTSAELLANSSGEVSRKLVPLFRKTNDLG